MKSIFLLIFSTLLLTACSTTKVAAPSEKVVAASEKSLSGNWELRNVDVKGVTGKLKVNLFNEADYQCFIGSQWNFNSRNNLGTYTITNGRNDCAATKRNIRWSVYKLKGEPNRIQFKRLDDKYNALDNGDGFRLDYTEIDKNNIQLKSNIVFEDRPASVIYNFVKN